MLYNCVCLAACYHKCGKHKQAMACVEAVLAVESDLPDALLVKCKLLTSNGGLTRCLVLLEEAIYKGKHLSFSDLSCGDSWQSTKEATSCQSNFQPKQWNRLAVYVLFFILKMPRQAYRLLVLVLKRVIGKVSLVLKHQKYL